MITIKSCSIWRSYVLICALSSTSFLHGQVSSDQPIQNYDVVVYGATSAGIASAVQVARMGKTVLLIEPGNRIGGLTTGGLGKQILGISRL